MRRDGQLMAHGHTSAEEIPITNRSAIAAYEGLASAELLGGSIGKSNGLFHRLRAPTLSPTLHHRIPSSGTRAPARPVSPKTRIGWNSCSWTWSVWMHEMDLILQSEAPCSPAAGLWDG